jgi:hypothetical protein
MSITASRLRQIIKEEVQRAASLTEGYPNTMGYSGPNRYDNPIMGYRGTRQYDRPGGSDEEEYGSGRAEFRQHLKVGDMVKYWDGTMATVVYASGVDSEVRIRLQDGRVMTVDGDYLER